MNIQQDFEELLRLLEKYNVKYMVVGGYAVAFHSMPRFTKDIDIYYKNNIDNIKLLQKALAEFGFTDSELSESLFLEKGSIVTFGIEPVRVDIINEIDGINFDEAWPNCVRGNYGKVEINYIGRIDLIKNKSSTKRLKDKADLENLQESS